MYVGAFKQHLFDWQKTLGKQFRFQRLRRTVKPLYLKPMIDICI
jgi:hypothetical protein